MKRVHTESSSGIESLEKITNLQKEIIAEILGNNDLKINFVSNPEDSDEEINNLLKNNGELSLVQQTHKFLISQIAHKKFFNEQFNMDDLSKYFTFAEGLDIKKFPLSANLHLILNSIERSEIPDLLEAFHLSYLNTEYIYKNKNLELINSKLNLKERGAVYTKSRIAKEITVETITNWTNKNSDLSNVRILDFGCGTGRFYLQALNFLVSSKKILPRDAIAKNLFAVDLDGIAIDILKIKVLSILENFSIEDIKLISNKIIVANGLKENILGLFGDFLIGKMFDIVLSNPPYYLLKVNNKCKEGSSFNKKDINIGKRISNEIKFFRESGLYPLSSEGMLNYYKLSIERIFSITKHSGEVGIICPSTLFSDISSKNLRKNLLLKNKIYSIKYYAESSKLFENVSQSTVIFYASIGGRTDEVSITASDQEFKISLDLISRSFKENYEVPYIGEIGWSILEKLAKHKKLSDFKEIRNRRGELDVTLLKKYILKEPTPLRLVRGNMISNNKILNKNGEYVLAEFIKSKSKDYQNLDFNKSRLVCPQISNIDTKKRLNFVLSEKNDVIANSCNYLSIINEKYSLKNLQVILNSYLLNWRFKITSGNNHISNYELDDLPLVDSPNDFVFENSELNNNIKVCQAYDLDEKETLYILKEVYKAEEIEEAWQNFIKIRSK